MTAGRKRGTRIRSDLTGESNVLAPIFWTPRILNTRLRTNGWWKLVGLGTVRLTQSRSFIWNTPRTQNKWSSYLLTLIVRSYTCLSSVDSLLASWNIPSMYVERLKITARVRVWNPPILCIPSPTPSTRSKQHHSKDPLARTFNPETD